MARARGGGPALDQLGGLVGGLHLFITDWVAINMEFQDIVRLTQRLIELGKTNWTLAPYPVESHAFLRPSSWADEYRRIFELFERELGAEKGGSTAGGARSGVR